MKRRGAQKGSLVRRGPSWILRMRRHTVTPDGKMQYSQTTKTIGPAVGKHKLSKDEAEVEANRLMVEANGVAAVPQLMATVEQFVRACYLPGHVALKRPAGQIFYRSILRNHILPALGALQLREVTKGAIQTLLAAKAKAGLRKETVTHIRKCVTGIFQYAKILGYWRGELPTEGTRVAGADAKPQRALTITEYHNLLRLLPARYQPLITLMVCTGMRVGETLGLTWEYVNLTEEQKQVDGMILGPYSLGVAKTYSNGHWGPPKTPKSRRVIPLTSTAWVALSELRERDLAGQGSDPVFRVKSGRPWDAHNIANRVLKPAGEKMSCPWLHFHAFRHTNASLANLDTATRQKVLGHTNMEMTVHYTHPQLEKTRAGLEVIS